MTEHCLFDRNQPFPFSPEWYADRAAAPHLDEPGPGVRLRYTAQVVHDLVLWHDIQSVVDLGAGDGGLLSLLDPDLKAWGYDLQLANVEQAQSMRGVQVELLDFVASRDVTWAELAVITECLEHLEDPHAVVRRIGRHCRFIVATVPIGETPESHYEYHTFGWDEEGFRALLEQGGYRVIQHDTTLDYQLAVGVRQ